MHKEVAVDFDGQTQQVTVKGSIQGHTATALFEGPHSLESAEVSVKDGVLSFEFVIQKAPPPSSEPEAAPEAESEVPSEEASSEEAPAKPPAAKKKK